MTRRTELPADAQFYTIEELREEMKKLAWTKGDFTIVPYGQLWGSMMYGSSRWARGSSSCMYHLRTGSSARARTVS